MMIDRAASIQAGKILVLLILLTLPAATGSAAIDSLDIVNIFPDTDNRFRDTSITVRLEAGTGTVTTNISVYLEAPDDEIKHVDTRGDVRVPSGNSREVIGKVDDEEIDQYGEYVFMVNETSSGAETNVTMEVIPKPDVELDLHDEVFVNGMNEQFLTVNVNTRQGDNIRFEEIQGANLSLYRITDNSSTTAVEKTLELTTGMYESETTRDLERVVDTSNLETGQYEAFLTFNISSCTMCENYTEVESDGFIVRTQYDRKIFNDKWGDISASQLHTRVNRAIHDVSDVYDAVQRIGGVIKIPWLTDVSLSVVNTVLILIALFFIVITGRSKRGSTIIRE